MKTKRRSSISVSFYEKTRQSLAPQQSIASWLTANAWTLLQEGIEQNDRSDDSLTKQGELVDQFVENVMSEHKTGELHCEGAQSAGTC